MKRTRIYCFAMAVIAFAPPGRTIETGQVDFGVNGSYDGTVWVTRDSSGSLVFRDQQVGSSVTLQEIVQGKNDHGSLSGLGDDDHTQYLTDFRHALAHTASFNDQLVIPPDLDNNVTLGGHLSDGNIHVQKDGAETITGAWRFTGTPVFAPRLRLETVPPDTEAIIEFGPDFDSPRFSYLSNLDEFEFTRPINASSGSLTNLVSSRIRLYVDLNGLGLNGQPTATLSDFASINGIDSADLLDRSVNEDIGGQWDFLDAVRIFGDLDVDDLAASGVIGGVGIELTTESETAEQCGMFSHVETTSDTLKVVLDRNNNQPGYKRFRLYAGDHMTNPAWELINDGDIVILSGYTNAGVSRLQIGGDATAGFVRRSLTGARFFLYDNGNIVNILPSTDGSDLFKVQDSQLNDVFSIDSNGNVAMVANAKQTIPDGTQGPFIEYWHAPTLLDTALTANEDLTTAGVWTSAATGTLYFDWPVPSDILGADVVVDRCTIYYDQVDAQDYIDRIRLVAFGRESGQTVVINHTDDLKSGTEHQWIDSDYTMADDRSYLLAVDLVRDDGAWIRSFKIEYHLE